MVHTCYNYNTTREKNVSIPGFELTQGACIRVLFVNGNSVAYPILNVSGTGAKEILSLRGKLDTIIETTSDIISKQGNGICSWKMYTVLDLYYNMEDDFDNWIVIGDPIVFAVKDYSKKEYTNISIIGNVQKSILY